jgi:hypothetical protein
MRAKPAAIATVAAHEQGKFWAMHDLMFENQGALEDADLRRYAQRAGLDMAKFDASYKARRARRWSRRTARGREARHRRHAGGVRQRPPDEPDDVRRDDHRLDRRRAAALSRDSPAARATSSIDALR